MYRWSGWGPDSTFVAAQLVKDGTEFGEHNTDVLSDFTEDRHGLRPLRCKNKSNQNQISL
jgi:hypothetical protein